METTPSPLRISLWWTYLAISALSFTPSFLYSQCDTEVSGVYTYCNAVGTPGTTGYFVAFRVVDPTGDTLNVVDLNGNNVTNRGKRINDINTQAEPATVTIVPLRITGVGADTVEYWYFGPYANGTSFDIALVDPSGTCDTVFVASGSYSCVDNSGISDPGACDNDVPLFFLDFSQTEFTYGGGGGGNENFDEIFLIMQRSRESVCCDVVPSNQNCFEFIVRLADQDVGLAIDDVGSGATAGKFYADTLNMFMCTGNSATTYPFTQGGGQSSDLPLCLSGGSQEFIVLSCKSGNNVTGVSVDAISNILAPPQTTIEPCNIVLEVFNVDSAFYSSPDDPNLDNLLSCTGDSLMCTFFYDVAVFGEVTVCEGDTFVYIIGGMPEDNACIGLDTILYDTTYVVVYPTFSVEIDTICNPTGDSLIMSAVVSSPATGCDYAFLWSTGDTTQTITVPFSSTEYFVTVTRADLPSESQSCVPAVDSVIAEGGLVVSCENIGDTLYTCINELPDADTSLVIITGCINSNPLIFVEESDNGGSGCIGDTLVITRLYIVDADADTITTTTDQDTCTQLLSFVDNVAPIITSGCPANVTVSCVSQVPTASPTALSATDNCGGSVVIIHAGDVISNQTCTNRFTITRTYRATDECGNSSTCNQTITVFDNTPPSIACPAHITVQCASQVPMANIATVVTSDNCGGMVTVTHTGDVITNMTCANRLIITRTYSASDVCGNSATCNQIITVFDDMAPTFTCPANVTVQCASNVPAVNTAAIIPSENCGGASIVTHVGDVVSGMTCVNRFNITRTYRATDACGNSATCAQFITVFDNTLPIITCPANLTIDCTQGTTPATTGMATATDNCGGTTTVTFTDTPPGGLCPAAFSRTWIATDVCGNSATCVQLITIDDDVPPMISCPANVTIDCAASTAPANTGTATATDNCTSSPVVTPTDITIPGNCLQEYTILRTWTASDICQNTATCLQTISVEDNTAPFITCPPDVTVECANEVPFPNPEGIVTTDNCGPSSAVFFGDNISNQTCANRFTISRTYRATDACGNTATCVQTITVFDDTPPMITCPPPITVECAGMIPPASPLNVTAFDNCGQIPSVMPLPDMTVSIVCANNFTIARTYMATDACGNTATCIQAIIVSDDTSPFIFCPANITINSTDDSSPVNTGNPVSSDNCGGTPMETSSDVIVEDDCPGDYTIIRTWIATDECQNSATCIQQIVVEGPCNVDLALVKNLDPGQGAISGGDNVNFTITVTNEGLVPVGSITIVDYIPDGFVLNDLDWIAGVAGSTGQSASIILSEANGALPSGGLQPTQTVSVQITLQAEPDITSGLYINVAEITAVFDTNGNNVTNNDLDSDPDTDDTNDPPTEDDHDPELICVLAIPVILGDVAVCTGDTTTYTLLNYNAANAYMWTISGGGIIIENNDSSIVVSWTGAPGGPFTITVVETAGIDCQVMGTLNVNIQGGEAIACLDHVNLSIDNECGTVVTSGMILTGDQTGNNNFTVYVIDMNGDTVPNATLTFMHLGQTFKVSVVSECAGQSCWGFLTVEDKLPPQLVCACPVGNEFESCEISCLLIDEFLNGEIPIEMQPVPVDNCGGTTVEIVDIDLNFETCAGGYFHVTWLATDVAGNTSICVQEFPIVPLTLDSLVFPADFFGDCSDSSDPDSTGWPTVDGLELSDVPSHCNIIATYTDTEIDLCGDGIKLIRRWSVFDWCVPEIREFVQVIILADTTGPVLTCPVDLTVGTDVWFCYANVLVPKPAVTADCSAIKTFHLFSPAGTVVAVGSNFRINNLPIGTHTLTWTVYDECHNSSSCSFEITVIDNVPPVPACQQHLIVSLTNDRPNGITLVPASLFNDGSIDNCTAVTFRARRMQSCIDIDWTTNGACVDDIPGGIPPLNAKDFGTVHGLCVPFACCDVNAGPIMVELEVTDGAGNVNYCMVEVEVQDKLAPVVTCPPDITISCEFEVDVVEGVFRDVDGNNDGTLDEDPLSEIFGNLFDAFRHDESARQSIIINDPGNDQFVQPFNWGIDGWATDNCGANLTVEVTEYSDCSGETLPGNPPAGAIGLITRRFRAIDNSGNPSQGTCLQRIWIIDYDPFYITDTTCANFNPNDGVIWPCDVLLNTCPEEITGTGAPVILDDLCSLIGVSFEDTRFDFADGSCYKILREWFIIDWCQFDANTGAGIWSYTQTIKVADAFGPELLNCPQGPIELCIGDPGVTLPANNQLLLGENNPNSSSCSAHVTMSQSVRELCSESVIYDVKLYPFNGTEFIQLKAETVLPLNANNIGVMTFNTTQSTMQSIAQNGLPYNDAQCGDYHRLLWTVEDGCGNLSFCDHLIRLEDCKDPTPVCLNGISTMIMPMTGEVTIWASDFNASSVDDCTPSEALLYSFSETSYQPSFTYTCDNVPEFGVPLEEEIWVADGGRDQNCNGTIEWSERNTDVCVTYIIITDSLDVCDEQGLVLAGEIMTEHTDAVSQASVNLIGPSGGTVKVTSTDGKFTFVDVHPGDDYTIKPERNDDHRNGVSTMDLVRIQKHLLGREVFNSPYQYIAADANSSGSVSAIDLVEIRKLVLGVTTEFAYNKSWRFVKSGSEMAANHPWPFEETIEVQDLTNESLTDLDFVGVKIGDVNNTVQANAFQYLPRNSRRVLNMQATGNGNLKEGGLLEIKLSTTELLSGFQWTLETKGIEFVTASSDVIDIDHTNIGIHENGMVTMSWNTTNATPSDEVSLVLTFKVTHVGELKDMLKMSSSITEAEAYSSTGEILDVNLEFSGEELSSEFALYQNHPNPWNGHTVIGFDLPADAHASLIIYDVAGKIIKTIDGDYKKGYNTILISTRDISAPGVLYYRLESEGYSATKKMLIIQ